MSRVIGNSIESLNIESLEMENTVFDYFDHSKFEALYEGISNSTKLATFKLGGLFCKQGTSDLQILSQSEIPLYGIEKLSKSRIQNMNITFAKLSPRDYILNTLPIHLRELSVFFLIIL